MDTEFHISSAVVLCHPDDLESLSEELVNFAGVEVHGFHPEGKIVISLEAEKQAVIVTSLEDIAKLEQVLSCSLVYHQFEPASEEVL